MLRYPTSLAALLVPALALAMTGCAAPAEEAEGEGNSALFGASEPDGKLVPAAQARAWSDAIQGTWSGPAHAATETDVSAWMQEVPGTLAVSRSVFFSGHDVTVKARGETYTFRGVDLATIAVNASGPTPIYLVALDRSVDPRTLLTDPANQCWMSLRPGQKGKELGVFCNRSANKLLSYLDVSVPALK